MFHLLKLKRQLLAAIVWISVIFHPKLVIARKSLPPTTLFGTAFAVVSHVYKQVLSDILFPKIAMEKQQKRGICTQLLYKSYLIYS